MTTYTEEDFANARYAEHPDGRFAMRALDLTYHPWSVPELHAHVARSDADLASTGWRPVHEHNPHATNGWGGGALIGSPEDLSRLSNAAVPLTLDALREAWENAEVPTADSPIRDGDTAITQVGEDDFAVYRSCTGVLTSAVRILHRAPQPEPWQSLADEIENYGWEVDSDDPKALARHLHERGVRVVGGDES